MSQNVSTFHKHRNHILQYYSKEPVIFPYPRQYHSTRSVLTNPDTDYTDSYQNNLSHPPSVHLKDSLNLLNQTLVLKYSTQLKMKTSSYLSKSS